MVHHLVTRENPRNGIALSRLVGDALKNTSYGGFAAALNLKSVFNVENPRYGASGDGITNDTSGVQSAINAAGTGAVWLPSDSYLTDALTTSGKILQARNGFYSDARGLGFPIDEADMDAAAALTHTGEDYVYSYRNSNISGNDVYEPIFPNINHYDVVQGVLEISDGSTIEHATGIAGYVKNLDATTNGVALFGAAYVDVDNGKVWGLNTLLSDDAVRAAGTDLGRMLLNELDFNVMHPDTEVVGLSIGGNSLSQPTSANGFIANALGTGISWVTSFLSQDGAATNALGAGMLSTSGNSIDSQQILMSWSDTGGTKKATVLQVDSFSDTGFLTISSTGTNALKISAGNVLLDTGQGLVVNGNVVLSDRITGWGAPTGTATRTAFATGSVTLSQLAERVKALIDDLTTHGMIGA